VLRNDFLFTRILHYKSTINHVQVRLDRLIVVDDDIKSSFSSDNEGNKAIIGGRRRFVVVERCFICIAVR
jgi:hypothetical protein